ncbi:hypothetical protein BO70DRAFT_362256 [Aspergillus heteromorphus CBS 117.55]|uniref:Pentatricopeptide repeat protein n=1 Tax=Aspergillus heteromorphus CBS 117.55 TaxID=1448321 RepID=A0A317W7G5_9EURO|nr:uncharacterized protein BO70DRAFT_362256 [Aspergillus heteromorphus CBS 117.55]PWY81825.1 hypothetical protein BO70DRAFT_362256 [Aspergillus heteromorphus CBS 117.55]
MSLCSHPSLRLCLRAGGHSYAPEHSLCLGRSRRVAARHARSFGSSTPQPWKAPHSSKELKHGHPKPASKATAAPKWNRVIYRTQVLRGNVYQPLKRFLGEDVLAMEKEIRDNSLASGEHGSSAHTQWRTIAAQLREGVDPDGISFHDFPLESTEIDLLAKIQTDCLGSFREAWEKLDLNTKATAWERLSLALLRHRHYGLLLEFLWVTSQGSEKPVLKLAYDCLKNIMECFPGYRDWTNGELTFRSVVQTCLAPENWPVVIMTQNAMRLFLDCTDGDGVRRAWDLSRKRKVHIVAPTLLHFMSHFVKLKDADMALEVLKVIFDLRQEGFTTRDYLVTREIAGLLGLDSVVDGPDGRNFHILPRILKIGVRLDMTMMNAILKNTFKTGDPQLSDDILEYIKKQGMKFNAGTYIAQLGDALDRRDQDLVKELLQEIDTRPDLRTHPWLASKIFHAHFVFNVKGNRFIGGEGQPDLTPEQTFYSMLDVYNKYFDIAPLQELYILAPGYTPPESDVAKLEPTRGAMFLLIASYLRCKRSAAVGQRIYARFIELLVQGDKYAVHLAKTDHIFNEFIISWRNDPRGGRPSVRVVEDMLYLSAQDPEKFVKPTVLTWTVLLSVFIYTKQQYAANKVREMMAKHQIVYDLSTWNLIISGLVMNQDVDGVAKAIQTMQQEGLSPDAYTIKHVNELGDLQSLVDIVGELNESDALASEGAAAEAYQAEMMETERLVEEGLVRLKADEEDKS